jgi:hypothetical protein
MGTTLRVPRWQLDRRCNTSSMQAQAHAVESQSPSIRETHFTTSVLPCTPHAQVGSWWQVPTGQEPADVCKSWVSGHMRAASRRHHWIPCCRSWLLVGVTGCEMSK